MPKTKDEPKKEDEFPPAPVKPVEACCPEPKISREVVVAAILGKKPKFSRRRRKRPKR